MTDNISKGFMALFIEKIRVLNEETGVTTKYTPIIAALFKKQTKFKPTQFISFLNSLPDYVVEEITKENGITLKELKNKIKKLTNNYRAKEYYKKKKRRKNE